MSGVSSHAEFVSLAEAAAAAHHALFNGSRLRHPDDVATRRREIVLALSALCLVYVRDGQAYRPASRAEMEARFGSPSKHEEFTSVYIRRAALVQAVERLAEESQP